MSRLTVYSATLSDADALLLELISRREHGGNRSAVSRGADSGCRQGARAGDHRYAGGHAGDAGKRGATCVPARLTTKPTAGTVGFR